MTTNRGQLARLVTLLCAVLMLGACGAGSDDFSVQIAHRQAGVIAAFDNVRLDSSVASMFPGRKLDVSHPKPNEVLYTAGGGDGDGSVATVRFRFEPGTDNKSTTVYAAVDVPTVEVKFKGERHQLDEVKVDLALYKIVRSIGRDLEKGSSASSDRQELSNVLTVLAVFTDRELAAKLAKIMEDPEGAARQMGWLGGDSGVFSGSAPAGLSRGVDPNNAVRDQERQARAQQEAAAMPMDAATGSAPTGSPARGMQPSSNDQSGGWGSDN